MFKRITERFPDILSRNFAEGAEEKVDLFGGVVATERGAHAPARVEKPEVFVHKRRAVKSGADADIVLGGQNIGGFGRRERRDVERENSARGSGR